MSCAVVVDVDGVVSAVHPRHGAWGDEVVAGNVFGPVLASPTLCARLDALSAVAGLECLWLTSWSSEMRASMSPFPGASWPVVAEQPLHAGRRSWWKLEALEAWLAGHPGVRSVAWSDDHLRPPARSAAVRRRLSNLGVDTLLLAPETAVGLTPADMERLEGWAARASS